MVSKQATLVRFGSIGSSALRLRISQPPTEIQASRSPCLLVAEAMISAQRTVSSLISKVATV
jgi:hypothetical protein